MRTLRFTTIIHADRTTAWQPAFESYSLSEVGESAELAVEMDVTPDFEEYVNDTWPRASARLEAICEATL